MKVLLFCFFVLLVSNLCISLCPNSDSLQQRVKRSQQNRPVKQKALLERNSEGVDENGSECDDDGSGGFGESFREILKSFKNKWRRIWGQNVPPDEEDLEETDTRSVYEKFVGNFQPWWKGPNVCKMESEKRLPPSEDDDDWDPLSFFQSSTCTDTGKSYRCSMKAVKNNTNILRTLTYECCHGYGRKKDQSGCTKKLNLKPLTNALNDLNLTKFVEALTKAGLIDQFDHDNYTIFAPTNEAVESPKSQSDITFVVTNTNDKMMFVRDVLSTHVVKKRLDLDEMEDEQRHETIKPKNFVRINFFSYPKAFVTVNCAKITSYDNQYLNGIIHVVDRVLPQSNQNLLQLLESDPRFQVFVSMMSQEMKNLLSRDGGHYTVFAFTDEGFENLPQKTKERFKTKDSCFSDVTKHHVLRHTICTSAVQGRAQVINLNGYSLSVNRSTVDDSVYVNGKKFITVDRMATNGVLHAIDGVITFPENEELVDALENQGYSELANEFREAALTRDIEQLKSAGLFVPPKRYMKNITSLDAATKHRLLQNHIVGKIQFSPYRFDTTVETKAGVTYRVSISRPFSGWSYEPAKRTIGCAKLVKQSVNACNGVIRFIDRILPLPVGDVLEVLRSRPELSVFTMMVEASGLDRLLTTMDRGPFGWTVFATDNDAMERHVNPETQRTLLNDHEKLKDFVKRHLVLGRICCHHMESQSWFDRKSLESEGGTSLEVRGMESEEMTIDQSTIKQCNVEGTNGIVHIINRPLPARRRFFGWFDG